MFVDYTSRGSSITESTRSRSPHEGQPDTFLLSYILFLKRIILSNYKSTTITWVSYFGYDISQNIFNIGFISIKFLLRLSHIN